MYEHHALMFLGIDHARMSRFVLLLARTQKYEYSDSDFLLVLGRRRWSYTSVSPFRNEDLGRAISNATLTQSLFSESIEN